MLPVAGMNAPDILAAFVIIIHQPQHDFVFFHFLDQCLDAAFLADGDTLVGIPAIFIVMLNPVKCPAIFSPGFQLRIGLPEFLLVNA